MLHFYSGNSGTAYFHKPTQAQPEPNGIRKKGWFRCAGGFPLLDRHVVCEEADTLPHVAISFLTTYSQLSVILLLYNLD